MDSYKLEYSLRSPTNYPVFAEFSPDGRFLAVGDRSGSKIYLLDRLVGFNPKISANMREKPTALVWESCEAFYVGLVDGRLTHFRINLKDEELVEGTSTCSFCGVFPVLPIRAMALDVCSETLVVAMGPEVFAFRRIRSTSTCHSLMNQDIGTHGFQDNFRLIANLSSRFNLTNDPGRPAPLPRAICFSPNNKLVITFCHQYIV